MMMATITPSFSSSFQFVPPMLLTCMVSVTTFAAVTLGAPALQFGDENEINYSSDLPQCGGSIHRKGRIIGGREADPTEVPWIASIQNKGFHFCGASIISNSFLLSAAHCFSHLDEDAELSVVLGTHRIPTKDSIKESSAHVRISVKRVINHPNFDGGIQYLNDIAVVELVDKIQWNHFVKPICLPNAGENFGRTAAKDKNISAVAHGWGRTWGQKLERTGLDFEDEYKVHSDVLKTLNLTILPNSECDEYYQKSTWHPMTLASSQMCAGVPDKSWNEDTASGDSGGPLAIFQHGRWTVVGVTSFGTPYRAPGVYCRVASFIDWIKEITVT